MILNLLKSRYSCRNFSNKPISDEIIRYILECGRLSSSGGNDQPWKFGVITDAAIIEKISEATSVNYDQTKIPGEHMVLADLEHGIYSTWISSMDCEMVGEIIGIEGYLVSNVIVFGYPEQPEKITPKKEMEDIIFTNRFDNTGF